MNPKKPAALPPSAIYFLKGDLESLEARCDLGDFRKTDACLYPHKDTAEREDCVVFVPEALAEQREREARAKAFAEGKEMGRIEAAEDIGMRWKETGSTRTAALGLLAAAKADREAITKAARERAGEGGGGK
jgi:hypothetical protein